MSTSTAQPRSDTPPVLYHVIVVNRATGGNDMAIALLTIANRLLDEVNALRRVRA